MIVCICHRVSDRAIQAAVRSGTTCFDVLQDDLAVASSCGCCHDCARDVFDAACAEMPQVPTAAALSARRVFEIHAG